jgi:hypothetical protein
VGIEAETPEAAAAAVSDKPTDDADNIEDCDGENLAALVDTEGDEDLSRSLTIDFEPERMRKAASNLLAALEAIIGYAENEAFSLEALKDGPEAEAESDRAWKAVETAQDVISQVKGVIARPRPTDTNKPVEV